MKYWVYLNGEVPGSYIPEELAAIPGIGETTMVCPAEGGIEERNWLRAGQFPELVEAMRKTAKPPISPEAPMPVRNLDPGRPLDPNDILNDSSSRIFSHVSDLMKELENRRAERAMNQSLQRQIVELKNELLALRERNQFLTDRADLIPGFQDSLERQKKDLDSTAMRLGEQETQLQKVDAEFAAAKDELNTVKRAETSLAGDLKRQAETIENLSHDLAQKEFTLAKAFGVIRRLEEVMGEILPSSVEGISRDVPGYKEEEAPPPPPPEETPEPEISVREVEPEPAKEDNTPSSYTDDTGQSEKSIELPTAGEVTPIPAPWTKIVDKIKGFLTPEEKSEAEGPETQNDKTPDQS